MKADTGKGPVTILPSRSPLENIKSESARKFSNKVWLSRTNHEITGNRFPSYLFCFSLQPDHADMDHPNGICGIFHEIFIDKSIDES